MPSLQKKIKLITIVLALPTIGFIGIIFILLHHEDPDSLNNAHYEIDNLPLTLNEHQFDNIDIADLELTLSHHFQMAHVIADKNNKILYCAIPKNSCTVFKLLFHIMNNPTPSTIKRWETEQLGHIHAALDRSLFIGLGFGAFLRFKARNQKIDSLSSNKLLRTFADYITDKQWRKLVIIRDPLERLLSGYLDKCVGQNMDCFKYKTEIWKGDRDIVNKNNFTIFVNHFMHNLSEWENIDKNGPFHAKWSSIFSNHFSPQYSYCNLERIYQKYFTDIIYYHHSSIGDDAINFLKSLNNIDIQWLYQWGPYKNKTMFNVKSIHVTSKDLTNDLNVKANFYRQYYYDRAYAEYVMKLFEKDYRLFNISKPKWIEYL